VDKAVQNGIVEPGKYLVLEFDFSCVDRPCNLDESAEHLREEINIGLSTFKHDYAKLLGLSGLTSGANDLENISFKPWISTISGLTRSDVLGALRVICNNEEEVEKHFKELQHHTNGYHFCQKRSVNQKSGSVRKQLQSYVSGATVQKEIADKNFRAFTVVIVESRQILVREMDRHGKCVSNFQLAEWAGNTGKQ